MVYSEPWEENSNIILNHLLIYIKKIFKKGKLSELVLVSDTHSTQRSNLIICFFDYIVRVRKLFETVTLVYFLSGHHDHDGDRAHSKLQKVHFYTPKDVF